MTVAILVIVSLILVLMMFNNFHMNLKLIKLERLLDGLYKHLGIDESNQGGWRE
jgi:hypothetical protein